MAFNLYFAGGHTIASDEFMMKEGGNRLFTQSYERSMAERWLKHKRKGDFPNKIFVDSSAYSAHTKGLEVDIDEYIAYINSNKGMFECIAELDEIPGEYRKPKTREQMLRAPAKSWENYLYMRERVIDNHALLPIFHQGEDFKWLELMLETTFENGKHIPYIGISPANDVSTPQKDIWMEQVFRVIRDSSNPEVKTHAFGMTALKQLERHPFYSADSTSAIMTGAMGSIMTPKGMLNVSDKSDGLKVIQNSPKIVQDSIAEIVSELGYTIEEVASHHQIRAFYNIKFLTEWAKNYKFIGIKHKQKKLF